MDEIDKIYSFAREAKVRLRNATFESQSRIHKALEQKYGITLKQVISHACRLSDEGRISEAEDLANSAILLKGGKDVYLSFDRSLIPKPEPSHRETLGVQRPEEKNRIREVRLVSPTVDLLMKIREQKLTLDDLHWREFEKVVAELLKREGWIVKLQQGSKDRGVDIRAERRVPGAGSILTIWQAKHLSKDKVGISVVRELADVTRELGGSKGVIITSSFLTNGALRRIERNTYTLGKVDRSDLLGWIHTGVAPHSALD
jgi:hypothetical protein